MQNKVPKLNIDQFEKEIDSDELMKPLSNRQIYQGNQTVLKIEAQEWNNVPQIVYESVVRIVSVLDQNER